jgi:threonyl-tRNA synthetase
LYHQVFRFPSYRLALSTRPTHGYIGTNEQWEHAERILHTAIREHLQQHNGDGRDSFDVKQGDGAFYGPKIDLQLTDSQQRTHQLATIQLDFQLPERFQLTYSSADGTLDRPVLVHRAALGSLERFWAIWMEECKGRWPFWCSPRQFMLIPHPSIAGNPLGDEFISRLAERLGRRNGGVRYWVDVDRSDATLAKKVFHADQLAYNYILVIGKREIETGKLSVRSRRGETVVGGDDNKSAVISIDDLCAEADRLSESHL